MSVQSEIESYKVELKEYSNKLREAFQEMAGGKLPSRLVQPDTLRWILAQQQLNGKFRSIPNEHLTLYYELELLRNVYVGEHGIFLKLEIPLFNQNAVYRVFEGIPLPQPIGNSSTASTLTLKNKLIALSDASTTFAEVDKGYYYSCRGSRRLRLCPTPLAVTRNQQSGCLLSLFFGHEAAALQNCNYDVIHLPAIPTATYLADSLFLMTAANPNYWLLNTTKNQMRSDKVQGCRSCLVQPPCEGRIEVSLGGSMLYPSANMCPHETGLIINVEAPPLLKKALTIPLPPQIEQKPDGDRANYQRRLLEHVTFGLQQKPTLEVNEHSIEQLLNNFDIDSAEFPKKSTLSYVANILGFTAFLLLMILVVLIIIWAVKENKIVFIGAKKKPNNRGNPPISNEELKEFSTHELPLVPQIELLSRVREQNRLEISSS